MVTVVRRVLVGFGWVLGSMVLLPLGPVIALMWAAKWLTPAEVGEALQGGERGVLTTHGRRSDMSGSPLEAWDVLADSWSGVTAVPR